MDEREFFFRVVEAKGFAAAARRLETTAASVSRRIKALEQRLGVRLLQRTTRTLSLTEAGKRYYLEGRRLWSELGDLERSLTASTREPTGDLKIIAPMSFGQKVLAPLIAGFALEHRKIRISLILDDNETDPVEMGADLTIRIGYPADSSMIAQAIAPVARYLCASPAYLERRGQPTSPRDLLKHDCLHYNVISEREEWSFIDEAGEQTLTVRGMFCSNNGDVLVDAAIQGLGIALLPDFIVDQHLRQGRLVRLLEAYERVPMSLFALYPSRHHVPAAVRILLAFIKEQLGAPDAALKS